MTRFSVLASVALAAGFAAAAPAPVIPHDRFQNYQVGSGNWNWDGQLPEWLTWYYTRTRTFPAPTATSVDSPAPTSAEVATSAVAEPTSEASTPSSSVPEVSETPAPEPTSIEVSVETSSVPPATSTVVPTTAPAAHTTTAAPTTTAAATTTAATTTKTSEGSSGNAEIDAYLKGHNDIRAQHGATALTWADDLAAAAAKWAENCVWEHSQGKVGNFGENLAAGTGLGAAAAVKMWTDEASEYDPSNPQYSHFTQVVWKATTEVGCAVRSCNNLLTGYSGAVNFHVCEYRSPGNVIGQFAENVQA